MDSIDIPTAIGQVIGAGAVGLVFGVATSAFCSRRGSYILAGVSFMACLFAGLMLGMIGALPTSLFFIFLASVSDSNDASSDSGALKLVKVAGCSAVILFGFACLLVGGFFLISYKQSEAKSADFVENLTDSVKKAIGEYEEGEALTGYRKFKSTDGRVLEGRILSAKGDRVKIERRDGKIFETSIRIYSWQDQEFIRNSAE